MVRPLYIFDLDGTLALIDHRRPILDNTDNPHRWDDFYRACVRDIPNRRVIQIMHQLMLCNEVHIWSGRSEIVRAETMEWLMQNTFFIGRKDINDKRIKMRPENDYTPDEILKEQWLNQLSGEDRERLAGIFDDREKVVQMWRRNGLTCFQVADGNF